MLKRFTGTLVLVVGVIIFIGAQIKTPESIAAASNQKVLTFGLSSEPATLEPSIQIGTTLRTLVLSMYRGLVNVGEDGKLSDELAESYKVAPDNITYIFKLRNAKFHNGDPVTAEDVKFTYERILDPKTKSTTRPQLSVIDKIVAVNSKTVSIKLKQPCAPFINYLALPESVILSKKWTESKNGDLSKDAMGAGPFQFVSWKKGQNIAVRKFDSYYKKGMPKLDAIKFTFIAEDDARSNAIRSGDVDIIEYVPGKDVTTLEKDTKLKLDKQSGPCMLVVFNVNFKPFSDPRVRQAISYAIDRQKVINTAFGGEGRPCLGLPVQPGTMAYQPAYDNYFAYNIDKAKQLLAEAGYPKGFKTRFLANSVYLYHQQTAIAIQDDLKKIGVDATMDLPDWAGRVKKQLAGDYDMSIANANPDITDPDWLSDYYYGTDTPALAKSVNFKDDELNRLLDQGKKTLDENKRKEIYSQFYKRAIDLEPLIAVNYRNQSYAMKTNVTGFKNLPGTLTMQSGYTLESTDIK